MSYCASRELQKSEATAARRTVMFHLTNTADGTDATGKTIAAGDFVISKAGAAFGNATGTVTEVSGGWYKMVFAAADLDTLGDLSCEITEAGCDSIQVTFQVVAHDPYADIAIIKGLVNGNSVLDNTTYDTAGMLTGGRIRVFETAALAEAATDGGTGEGELAAFTVAVTGSNGKPDLFLSSED
ncbi:MAG: hypothetical protein F9K40_03090 [Kofleriaceae bacterium]|nr:MAG: hypothetical protein F9K40_03090 [Kofleriaceae bacterium]